MKDKFEHPKGTMVIVVIYIITLAVLWSWVFLTLLERGVTQ
jgi:hypothetical protein